MSSHQYSVARKPWNKQLQKYPSNSSHVQEIQAAEDEKRSMKKNQRDLELEKLETKAFHFERKMEEVYTKSQDIENELKDLEDQGVDMKDLKQIYENQLERQDVIFRRHQMMLEDANAEKEIILLKLQELKNLENQIKNLHSENLQGNSMKAQVVTNSRKLEQFLGKKQRELNQLEQKHEALLQRVEPEIPLEEQLAEQKEFRKELLKEIQSICDPNSRKVVPPIEQGPRSTQYWIEKITEREERNKKIAEESKVIQELDDDIKVASDKMNGMLHLRNLSESKQDKIDGVLLKIQLLTKMIQKLQFKLANDKALKVLVEKLEKEEKAVQELREIADRLRANVENSQ